MDNIKSEKIFITNSFEETKKLGEKFARSHPFGSEPQGRRLAKLISTTIALYGDLGSGKTTFVQGLAKGLGIKRRIISPTFIIVRNYTLRIKNYESRIMNFYHIDLYRIDDKKSVKSLGLEEIMGDPQNIVVIEWAEKMGRLLPKERLDVKFEYVSESKRRITVGNLKSQIAKLKTIT